MIDIPRGTYVPTFSTRDRPGGGAVHTALRPGIAVVRFADLREGERRDPVPVALSESVARALSAFPELRIVGPVTTEESGAGLARRRLQWPARSTSSTCWRAPCAPRPRSCGSRSACATARPARCCGRSIRPAARWSPWVRGRGRRRPQGRCHRRGRAGGGPTGCREAPHRRPRPVRAVSGPRVLPLRRVRQPVGHAVSCERASWRPSTSNLTTSCSSPWRAGCTASSGSWAGLPQTTRPSPPLSDSPPGPSPSTPRTPTRTRSWQGWPSSAG